MRTVAGNWEQLHCLNKQEEVVRLKYTTQYYSSGSNTFYIISFIRIASTTEAN
jgi:hypothetical protein